MFIRSLLICCPRNTYSEFFNQLTSEEQKGALEIQNDSSFIPLTFISCFSFVLRLYDDSIWWWVASETTSAMHGLSSHFGAHSPIHIS